MVQIFEHKASKHWFFKNSFKNTIFQSLTLDLQLSFILKLFPFLKLYFWKASRIVLKLEITTIKTWKMAFHFRSSSPKLYQIVWQKLLILLPIKFASLVWLAYNGLNSITFLKYFSTY